MQAGPGGFGTGPEGDAAPVVVRIIAQGRLIGPVSWHRAK
jgi:hypothetical protein